MREFLLPDLGEGLEDAEIVAWHVSEGDHVVADQPLVSVETDKAVVEVPSPRSGRIEKLHGAKGTVVKVGAPLVSYLEDDQRDTGTVVGKLEEDNSQVTPVANGTLSMDMAKGQALNILPAIRALAKKLDVDLNLVQATGPNNTITRSDIERAARSLTDAGDAQELCGMRRAMAQRMAVAHSEVVRASITEEADIGDWKSRDDVSVRIVRGIAVACKAQPSLNAWYNSQSNERRVIERIDLGIAVDTDNGLIVPVLRNIGERDATDLREGLNRMRQASANRAVPQEELRGATLTLSNYGMIGGLFANMVVVPPQVAIIGAGRLFDKVLAKNGIPVVRKVIPLSLTFDHRVVTGGEAIRFLMAMKNDLEKSE